MSVRPIEPSSLSSPPGVHPGDAGSAPEVTAGPMRGHAHALRRLAATLAARADRYEVARCPRCVFARAYARLTQVLAESMPQQGLRDPSWVVRLAEGFAAYYLQALEKADRGERPASVWATVFEAGRQAHTSVLDDLLLGMTAHILHDLPLALSQAGLRTKAGASRIDDYHRLNTILAQAIDPIQQELSRRYDPVLGILDRLVCRYDERFTGYALRLSRASAWYNAERLCAPHARAAALRAVRQSTLTTLRQILYAPAPGWRPARLLLRRALHTGRRYPAATVSMARPRQQAPKAAPGARPPDANPSHTKAPTASQAPT